MGSLTGGGGVVTASITPSSCTRMTAATRTAALQLRELLDGVPAELERLRLVQRERGVVIAGGRTAERSRRRGHDHVGILVVDERAGPSVARDDGAHRHRPPRLVDDGNVRVVHVDGE